MTSDKCSPDPYMVFNKLFLLLLLLLLQKSLLQLSSPSPQALCSWPYLTVFPFKLDLSGIRTLHACLRCLRCCICPASAPVLECTADDVLGDSQVWNGQSLQRHALLHTLCCCVCLPSQTAVQDIMNNLLCDVQVWNVNRYNGMVGVFNLQGSSWSRTRRQFLIHDDVPPSLTTAVKPADIPLLSSSFHTSLPHPSTQAGVNGSAFVQERAAEGPEGVPDQFVAFCNATQQLTCLGWKEGIDVALAGMDMKRTCIIIVDPCCCHHVLLYRGSALLAVCPLLILPAAHVAVTMQLRRKTVNTALFVSLYLLLLSCVQKVAYMVQSSDGSYNAAGL